MGMQVYRYIMSKTKNGITLPNASACILCPCRSSLFFFMNIDFLEDGIYGILEKRFYAYPSSYRFGGLAVWLIEMFCSAYCKNFKPIIKNQEIFT